MRKKMKMKRRDVYIHSDSLETVSQSGSKFTYCISKTKESLESEKKHMDKAKEASKEYSEFLRLIEETRVKHAKKDRRGKPVMIPKMFGNGKQMLVYDIPDAENEESPFMKDVIKLEKKYNEAIDEHEKKINEFSTVFLDEEVEVDVWTIRLDDVPEKISQEEMDAILPFIEDSNEEK